MLNNAGTIRGRTFAQVPVYDIRAHDDRLEKVVNAEDVVCFEARVRYYKNELATNGGVFQTNYVAMNIEDDERRNVDIKEFKKVAQALGTSKAPLPQKRRKLQSILTTSVPRRGEGNSPFQQRRRMMHNKYRYGYRH